MNTRLALGLMSGTSLDGIDVSLVRTDGVEKIDTGLSITFSYNPDLRLAINQVLGGSECAVSVERDLTIAHAVAVQKFLKKAGVTVDQVDVLGFHGHTILHLPNEGRTRQIGDGQLLADRTKIDVVFDFRSNDVVHGGQGAPLVPIYHQALSAQLNKPVCILNIGGIANLTWIGTANEDLIAFDTGPGGGLLDQWVERSTGALFDANGSLARRGVVDETLLQLLLCEPYFDAPPPKSLDRNDFVIDGVRSLTPEDGAATLTAFTCETVARACKFLPEAPDTWLVSGGGRHNSAIMSGLVERLNGVVSPVESVGWDGDALEAQAFAYLAVRSLEGLPLTVPSTTGVSVPVTRGVICRPRLD